MILLKITTNGGFAEYIRADQIETIKMPMRDHRHWGSVVLIGGREIRFGTASTAARLLKQLREMSE